jgi:hypothetical protein
MTVTRSLAVAATFAAVAIGAAAPAHSNPELGTDCHSYQLNSTATSTTGETVRCLADPKMGYTWMVDTGKTQDPWVAGQIAWAACKQAGYSDAQCRAN